MKYDYKLVRERDGLMILARNFMSVTIHKDMDNDLNEFPPRVGDSVVVYNSMFDNWQTTIIKSVEKINEDEFKFITKNSNYTITRTKNNRHN